MKRTKRAPQWKYRFYEAAVQTPEQHADMFALIYADLEGKKAKILREDFCGTFAISCAWIKREKDNKAICVDLDSEPLAYGKKTRLSIMSQQEKSRIQVLQENVLSDIKTSADIIAACNFSFCIFKERAQLVEYFKATHRSLRERGILILELAGGPGMIEQTREQKTYQEEGLEKFTYIWHQKSFNPITHEGQYAIHFRRASGKLEKDVFTYDWRLWTIPELRDALTDAGYSKTHVYWEAEDNQSSEVHDYVRTNFAKNHYSWIAYVVAAK